MPMKQTMKFLLKVGGLIAFALLTSCSDDCTQEYDVYKRVDSRSTDNTALIITEDTCLVSTTDYSVIQIRNNAVLTLTGDDVVVQASVTFTGSGTLNVEESLLIGNNIFFLGEGAVVNVGKGLVLGHAVDQGGFGAEINYCNFQSIQIVDNGITVSQDCSIEFLDCETLGDTDVSGLTYVGRVETECGKQDTTEYVYKPL